MASVDDFDFVTAMRTYLLPYPSLAERFDSAWIEQMCYQAGNLVFAETNASVRLDDGLLSEDTFAFVVCQMVLRVMRYSEFSRETNGSYTYARKDDQVNTPSYDASPNLYVSKNERALINGKSAGRGIVGTAGLGLHRVYGM